jgi:hypothetical protein
MRQHTINIYKFDELSDKAKENALIHLWNVNVDHFDWWNSTYDDAKNIGLKLTGFDLDRGRYCNGEWIGDPTEVAENIIREHGVDCETYKDAHAFLCLIEPDGEDIRGFLHHLLEDYRLMLQEEYEYLISEEAIIEAIEANDYEFTEDGRLFK